MSYQRYSPRRPIKSFQDLEVYQTLLACAVAIFNRCKEDQTAKTPLSRRGLTATGNRGGLIRPENPLTLELQETIKRNLLECALNLPRQIAHAHSLRFSNFNQALKLLDEAMLACNRAIVYLDQYRDLCNQEIEVEFFEEQTRRYQVTRWKVMHLLRAWEKFSKTSGS